MTGAFGFSGRYIAERLLAEGQQVRTLTNHPDRSSPIHSRVEVASLDFRNADDLAKNLEGASVLYNTYWVRFAYGQVSHKRAVANSRLLIRAAEIAGIQRIVHLSVTQASGSSSLPYFRGKAEVEEAIRSSRLSYAILRPALIFGNEDILINNIAWLLRRFPIFAVPGSGAYRVQPIFAGDLAELAVEVGQRSENVVMDAVGAETYGYTELVSLIRSTINSNSRIVHLPASLVVLAAWMLGGMVGDVLLTKDEVSGLMADLLVSNEKPTGKTSFRSWLQAHRETAGSRYASELDRHFRS